MRFTIKGQTVAESTHTSNRREAERILAKRKTELVTEVVLAGKKPIKLHAALDAFAKSRAHMKSGQNCEIHIRHFKSVPDTYLDKVTDTALQNVLDTKRADGYAEGTIKLSVTYFNAMIKFIDEQGYTVRKKMKPIKANTQKVRWLTKDELKRLYAELDPASGKNPAFTENRQDNFDLARLLYETGARLTEIQDMNWSQIDLKAGTVFVNRKKGSISNTINMTAVMKEIYTRRRASETGEFVFSVKQTGAKHRTNHWINAAVKRAKLDESRGSVTLHTLRHTRACHLLQAGIGLLEVKTYLGHKTIDSTMVYVHVIEDEVMKKVVRVMDMPELAEV